MSRSSRGTVLAVFASLALTGCFPDPVAELQRDMQAQQEKLAAVQEGMSSLRGDVAALRAEVGTVSAQVKSAAVDAAGCQAQIDLLKQEAALAAGRYDSLANQLLAVQVSANGASAQSRNTSASVKKLQEEKEALEVKLARLSPKEPLKTIPRQAFVEKVTGMTPEQLVEYIGKPGNTFGRNAEWWYYERVTHDPILGKIDSSVQIFFDGGRVKQVTPSNN